MGLASSCVQILDYMKRKLCPFNIEKYEKKSESEKKKYSEG